MKISTFSIQLKNYPCQKRKNQVLFTQRVYCPRYIPLPLTEVLALTSTNGPLRDKIKVSFPMLLSEFPLKTGRKSIKLDLEAHRQKKTIIAFPIEIKEVKKELLREAENLFEGKKIYHNLLIISEISPDFIKIEPNPNFCAFPQNEFRSTASNLQMGIKTLTSGPPDESIKDLMEATSNADLPAAVKILSQDHPQEIEQAIIRGEIEQILFRQEEKTLQKILLRVASGILKSQKIFKTRRIQDLLPFLPPETIKEIFTHLPHKEQLAIENKCFNIINWPAELNEAVWEIASRKRKEINEILNTSRIHIEENVGLSLEEIVSRQNSSVEVSILRKTLSLVHNVGLFKIFLPSYIKEIARVVSEATRSKILKQIEKSNLLENVKQPLLHILAEKEFIYISMFSFTSPLFAAALLAAMLRGAKIKVFLDRREAAQASSQYQALIDQAEMLHQQYPHSPSFEIRVFSEVLHQKNIIFGSGTVIIGSQNLSERGLTGNLEDFVIIRNDRNAGIKKKEFEDLFSLSDTFIPFPEEIASQPWLKRAGLIGIKFQGKLPSAPEARSILERFYLSMADFRKAKNILELAQGKNFKIEVDLAKSFHPFMVGMDPLIAQFLTRFLSRVPLEFSFAPASSSGRMHPGTTAGLSGLIEHEYIAAELAVRICKILSREDLIDQALLAIISHDTYKNAIKDPQGKIIWERYNPSHGQLAAEKIEESFRNSPREEQENLKPFMADVIKSVAEHMSIFNKPKPTPILPQDPLLKWIVVLADMLASRKYIYVEHRARQPLQTEEVLNLLLNNSFSIEGEALTFLEKDQTLFHAIKEFAREGGYKITDYKSIPKRAKKLLRVAESLCDLFPDYKEISEKVKEPQSEKEKEIIARRNEILGAALLFGILRYTQGVQEPKSKKIFQEIINKLLKTEMAQEPKVNQMLKLILEADQKLTNPFRADLSLKDKPALWIICLANCMMTAGNVRIITTDEVEEFLTKAEESKTIWAVKKIKEEEEEKLSSEIRQLINKEYFHEIIQIAGKGLLSRINYRRKEILQKIHPEILHALIFKFKSILPSVIYENFYLSLSPYQRGKLVEKIREANKSEEKQKELIEEIQRMPEPEIKPSNRIFEMLAQTALANNLGTIEKLKENIDLARNFEILSKYDYFKQINTAVEYLSQKLANPKEKILVYGDYDVDGQTATTLLVKTLKWIKVKYLSQIMDPKEAENIAEETISYYIPHRLNEGYGLNADALELIAHRGFKTIITADCGIKDKELVKRGKKMGLSFIITDHHEPEIKDLPREAVAILNPKLDLPPNHPAHHLPGAGVAYKLAKALADKAGIDLRDSYLDSVALAAIADVVPMLGENRAFVRAGLKRLNSPNKNRGLTAILNAHRLENIDEEALSYFVAPLLNVVGRFGKAYEGMRLLMTETEKEASRQVADLFSYLEKRREIEQAILADAESHMNYDPEKDAGIAVAGEWHKGIIGLVASKLVAKYGVPSVTIGYLAPSPFSPEEPAYGSMRSIKGINAVKILSLCAKKFKKESGKELFVSFGGHKGAAGFKIEKDKIADFQKIYQEITNELVKSRKEKIMVVGTLGEGDISLEEVKIFRQLLSPFGLEFEEPRFLVKAKIARWEVFGRGRQHIRGYLEKGTPFIFFFGNQPWVKKILIQKQAKFVVKVNINTFKGKESVNLLVEDIKSLKPQR